MFQDKKGKWHEKKVHIASFNGKHNRLKSMVLLVLYARRFKHGDKTGLGVGAIVHECPVNMESLLARVSTLTRYHYLDRHVGINKTGRPVFTYCINEDKGKRFIEERMPADVRQRYVTEIKEYRFSHGR